MLRRSVLGVGLAGVTSVLSTVLSAGCGTGSAGSGRSSNGRPSTGQSTSEAPAYDPASYPPPAIAFDQLRKLYGYDQKATLDALLTNTRLDAGLRIEDLSYTGAKGTTIPIYLVAPATPKGRVPAVLLAGDTGSSRDVLLAEAEDLARLGLVVAIPDVPFAPTGDPQGDSTIMINAVLAQRRALDLLARRDDVDPTRLAMAGFGWGGAQAQIAAGVDTRLLGVVVAGCGGRWSRSAFRSARPADPKPYLDAMTRFDGVRYLSQPGKRQVLLQFGKRDSGLAGPEAEELATGSAGTTERRDYDAAHDLTAVAAAAADRKTFLRRVLRMK